MNKQGKAYSFSKIFDDCPKDIYARINIGKRYFLQKLSSSSQFKVKLMSKMLAGSKIKITAKNKVRLKLGAKIKSKTMTGIKMNSKNDIDQTEDVFNINDKE